VLEVSIFGILAFFIIGGSIAMIINTQTLFSAFGFLVAMIGLAGVFALLDSRFLAIAQLMVSVGGIVVLSMLTILTLNLKSENLPLEPYKYRWILLSSFLVFPIGILIYTSIMRVSQSFTVLTTVTSKEAGKLLFSEWVLPFEMVSILLLSAMVGAMVIAKKDNLQDEEETL